MTTVRDLRVALAALPDECQDLEVFVAQDATERAYRVGDPFLTTDGDVVLSIGAVFLDDYEEADDDDED